MSPIRYVTLDPTGNLTCLVLDPVPEADRPWVTAALMERCEQVGYLETARHSDAAARLQMMGGEFCGNASMAAAAFLVREGRIPEGADAFLEVSGARDPVRCRVSRLSDSRFSGTVSMPPVLGITRGRVGLFPAALVRMEGISHVILEDVPLTDEEAESLLFTIAEQLPDPAVGLLQWDSASGFMTPLVFVRDSGTLVWESGCGSGSTALGAHLAMRHGNGITRSAIRQPGGTLCTEVHVARGKILSVLLTGEVRIGETALLDTVPSSPPE